MCQVLAHKSEKSYSVALKEFKGHQKGVRKLEDNTGYARDLSYQSPQVQGAKEKET